MNTDNFGVPGQFVPDVPVSFQFDQQFVDSSCDRCEQSYDQIVEQIVTPFLTRLEQSENAMRELVAVVLGSIDSITQKYSVTMSKCYDKVNRAINSQLGEAYGAAAMCGIVYPTDQEVCYGLQTGRYLESCGFKFESIANGTVNAAGTEQTDYKSPIADETETMEESLAETPKTKSQIIEESFRLNDGTILPSDASKWNAQSVDQGLPVDQTPSTAGQIVNPLDIAAIGAAVVAGLNGRIPAGQQQAIQPEPLPTPREVPQSGTLGSILSQYLPFLPSALQPSQQEKEKEQRNKRSTTSEPWTPIDAPDWNNINACHGIKQFLENFSSFISQVPENMGFTDDANGDKKMPEWFKPIYDNLPWAIDDAAYYVMKSIMKGLRAIIDFAGSGSNCNKTAMFIPSIISILGGFVSRWISTEAERFTKPYTLTSNYICPQELPTAAEATHAYIRGVIDYQTWQCWVRANNYRDVPQEKIVEANQTMPNISDYLQLMMRRHITPTQWNEFARRSGVLTDEIKAQFEKLVEAWPGMDDVVRFMTRDVDDNNLVERFGMDDEFTQKWKDKTQAYGEGLGMTTELARRYWRAHWQLPSPTQLKEMLHRNRKGRVPDDAVVSRGDVETALKQNDLLPFWVPKEIAISYAPLTRTDTQRAFFIGALKEKDVRESYLDLGYNDRDAEILVNFTKKLKYQYIARQVGLPTAKELSTMYSRHEITEQEFEAQLKELGYGDEEQQTAKLSAERLRTRRERDIHRKAIRRWFFIGSINEVQAENRLIDAGYGPMQANRIKNEWVFEREAKGKAIPAAMLCRMRERNLITIEEQLKGLVGLGYSTERARLIAQDCGVTITDRQMKKLVSELRRMEAAQEAERRRNEQLAKDVARKLSKRSVSEERIVEKTVAKIESDLAKARVSELLPSGPDSTQAEQIPTSPDQV